MVISDIFFLKGAELSPIVYFQMLSIWLPLVQWAIQEIWGNFSVIVFVLSKELNGFEGLEIWPSFPFIFIACHHSLRE